MKTTRRDFFKLAVFAGVVAASNGRLLAADKPPAVEVDCEAVIFDKDGYLMLPVQELARHNDVDITHFHAAGMVAFEHKGTQIIEVKFQTNTKIHAELLNMIAGNMGTAKIALHCPDMVARVECIITHIDPVTDIGVPGTMLGGIELELIKEVEIVNEHRISVNFGGCNYWIPAGRH